jgi:hypothetical protein
MSATQGGATRQYSRGPRLPSGAFDGPLIARLGLAAVAGLGVVLLIVSTFTPVIRIRVVTVIQESFSGYDRHSFALILLALFAAVMVAGAVRGARPAMGALAVCGLAVLLIALLGDLPDAGDTGQIGDRYEDAQALTGIGYYLETLGGVLLLAAGGGFLILAGREDPQP